MIDGGLPAETGDALPGGGRVLGEGLHRTFYPDGTHESVTGRDAGGNERWIFWYPDGTTRQEQVAGSDGSIEIRRYRPGGVLESTIAYRDGRKHGWWRTYDREGRETGSRFYEEGFPIDRG